MMFIKEWVDKQKERFIGRLVNQKIQELVNTDGNIVSWNYGLSTDYRGNTYNSYGVAVAAINSKYNAIDEWGVIITGNVIDVRAAFTVPAGLNVVRVTEEDIDFEMAFTNEFMKYNGLNDEIPFEFAKEEEIEGKLCIQLFWDPEHEWRFNDTKQKGMVKIRYLSWNTHKYIVHTDKDYLKYEAITYDDSESQPVRIEEKDFTYRRFGGRIDRPNEPAMKIWKCLTQINSLDQALKDWREINRLFASPTPYFETENKVQAKELIDELIGKNWKVKKLLAAPAKFYYVQPDTSGIQGLKEEIVTLAKMISGTTGVPVHFLGLPELMSNRSTAENLMELLWASTVKERETWNSAYSEILRKSIDLFNSEQGGKKLLKNDVLRIEIQVVSSDQWTHLEKVLLPAYINNAITLDYFLSQIPGLIIEEEKERREEEEKNELMQVKEELDKVNEEKDGLENNQFIDKEKENESNNNKRK